MAAVVPKRDCPHVHQLDFDSFIKKDIDIKSACSEEGCDAVGENWICCFCGCIKCSRYVSGHAADHAEKNPDHCIAVSFADCSCWCYKCDAYIEDPISFRFIRAVKIAKFGPEPDYPLVKRTPDTVAEESTVRDIEGQALNIRSLIPGKDESLRLENCSMCIVNIYSPLRAVRLIGCKKCTIHVMCPITAIDISKSEEITVRQKAEPRNTFVHIEDTSSVMMHLKYNPNFAFYAHFEVSNSTVGFINESVNGIILPCPQSFVTYDSVAMKFALSPLKE